MSFTNDCSGSGTNKAACKNRLYFGDNLDVLRRHIKDESVDLIYLDPPFNSKLDYNHLYKEPTGATSRAQADAFEDTWHWGPDAAASFEEILVSGSPAAGIVQSLRAFLGENDMMAYISMMTVRLIEMRRVLKPTGSLYLHCDPTAAHYLRIILDGIFGTECFRSEITWKRTTSHGNASRNFGAVVDRILFYTRSDRYVWNQQYSSFDMSYIENKFRWQDGDGRRWQSVTLRNPSSRPNLVYDYKASDGRTYKPHPNGWSCDEQRMRKYDREKRLHFPSKPTGKLRLKMYLDESPGVKVQNLWSDIPAVNSMAEERLGYPTQKPLALLQRIVATSSNPGDVVLDPFCGCGTAVHAAQASPGGHRRWIGIDVTHIAIQVILDRLKKYFPAEDPLVLGRPEDLSGARELARRDKYQFQWWASSLIGGQARGGERKGSDRGVDAEVFFRRSSTEYGRAIVSVKGGDHVSPSMIRDLAGTRQREGADMGIFICLAEPTREMKSTAAAYGTFDGAYPRIGIVTIDELLRRQSQLLLPPRFDTVTVRDEARKRGSTPKERRPEDLRSSPEFIWALGSDGRGRAVLHEDAAVFDESRRPPAESRKRARTGELQLDTPLLSSPQAKRRRG